MTERIICIALLIIAIGLVLELDRKDVKFQQMLKINDGLKTAIDQRDQELQSAYNEAQCYHEECVRLAFEYMSDTIYTLPCNGREVAIGGAR